MNASHLHGSGRWLPRSGAALILAAALVLAVASCVDKVRVPAPPRPSTAPQPAAAYDYRHELKEVERERRPVIALMRPGDVVQLAEHLPFGRGVSIGETDAEGKKSQVIIKDGTEDAPVRLPPQIRQYLVREMLDTREFVVVERERILELVRELEFGLTPATDEKTTPRAGRLYGVHYIVEANYYPVGALPREDPALDAVKAELRRRRIRADPSRSAVVYLNVYKVETGEVKAVACGAAFQPMVAAKRAVQDLLDQLADVVEPVRIVSVDHASGTAVLDIGTESNARVGDRYEVGDDQAEVIQVAPLTSTARLSAKAADVQPGTIVHRVAEVDR